MAEEIKLKKVRTVKAKPKKKSNHRLFMLVTLTICCIVISVTMIYLKRGAEREQAEKQAQIIRLNTMIKEEEQRSETIADYKAYVQTTSYIEDVAREVLGLVYKNEVLFVPKGE